MSKAENCKAVGKLLRDHIPAIIQNWLHEVKGIIPEAGKESNPILIDHLPMVLENIAEAFETGTPDRGLLNNHMAREHGKQREKETDFSLEDILKEYHILRKTIVKSLYDFTEFKLVPLLFLNQLLDQAIQASVVEYVTREKIHSEAIIQELNNEKSLRDKFVAALTHDMRTPLATARLSAQIIQRKPEDHEGTLKHTPRIISNIDRVDQMIQDLLDASLVKAGGHLQLEFKHYDLGKVVEDCISDLIALHGPRFMIGQLPTVTGYWSKSGLRRIIENLGNNAIKYGYQTDDITVSVKNHLDSVDILVANEGNPLSQADIDDLFEPFRRSTSARTSGQKGWGIGLTLVRGLVEGHGGTIGIDPKHSTGTTFVIHLPIDSRKVSSEV